MSVKKRFFLIMLAGLVLSVAAGCGDDGGGPDCEGVADLCEDQLGNYQCSTDSGAIEICQHNDDGCPVWTEYQVCAADEVCDDSGDAPECTCEDLCSTAGDTRCQGTAIQTCQAAADGCLDWAETQDCADDGLSCTLVGGEAQCSEGCTDECGYQDQRQCTTLDVIQLCDMGTDGCLHWTDEVNCADTLQICDDSSGTPACVDTCTGTCAVENNTRCEGTVIQICTLEDDGCRYWVDGIDCAEDSQVCEVVESVATCVDTCVDECDTVDATQCSGTMIQTCTAGTDGCNDWIDGTDCSATGEACDDTSGSAACVCVDECETVDATQCSGTVIQTCTAGTDGCNDWINGTDCSATGEACDDTSGSAACVCIDACTENETQCSGTVIQTCTVGTEGCTDWVDGIDCADTGFTCNDTAEPAVCETGSGDSCADVEVIATTPFARTGSDFTTDYSDQLFLSDGSCDGDNSGQVEAVFSITLATGDILRVEEAGGLDAVVSVQSSCGGDQVCLVSEDDLYADTILYTATADGTYTIIVEAWSATPPDVDYDIRVDVGSAEACGDTADNDLDGLVDCDDPDCFGNATYCTTELNCSDGQDNDSDTDTDCDDSDCADVPPCRPTINEVAYDDPSGDNTEFIEIYGEAGFSLSGYTLVHWNGSGGALIWDRDLSAYSIPSDGYLVIGPTAMAESDITWTDISVGETDAIQNGPDTLILYTGWDGSTGTVVDALAYEAGGDVAGEGNPSAGLASGNWNTSIGRYPDGSDTDDNETDFPALWFVTPGEPNLPAQPDMSYRNSGVTNTTITFPVAVPDNDATGVDLTQTVGGGAPSTIGNIYVGVKISHGWIGDLYVTLTSPTGTAVALHNNTGGSDDDIVTIYDYATAVDDATNTMDSFNGENPAGVWTLHVADTEAAIAGNVIDWFLQMDAP